MKVLALLSVITTQSVAQDDANVYDEAYARAHIAYTEFIRLGVTPGEYARCIRVTNFYEPGKTPRIASFNDEEFRDDGKGFDKVAGDGILTSLRKTAYAKGQTPVAAGSYSLSDQQYILHDPGFVHASAVPEAFIRIGITCDIVWVSCSSWPANLQSLCLELSWPLNGYFTNRGCKVGISIF